LVQQTHLNDTFGIPIATGVAIATEVIGSAAVLATLPPPT
jgi:hypothetical protein